MSTTQWLKTYGLLIRQILLSKYEKPPLIRVALIGFFSGLGMPGKHVNLCMPSCLFCPLGSLGVPCSLGNIKTRPA